MGLMLKVVCPSRVSNYHSGGGIDTVARSGKTLIMSVILSVRVIVDANGIMVRLGWDVSAEVNPRSSNL